MDHPKTMQGETMTTAQAVAAIERIIVAAGQSDFSRETIANARAGLDALLSELQTMRQSKEHESERAQSRITALEAEIDSLEQLNSCGHKKKFTETYYTTVGSFGLEPDGEYCVICEHEKATFSR